MTQDKKFVFDKRRFPRLAISFDVQIYSSTRVFLGNGVTLDISASGMRIKSEIAQSLRMGNEIFVTFSLPEGPVVDKIRGEIKGVVKAMSSQEIRFRFTEFKALDLLREYIEKKIDK